MKRRAVLRASASAAAGLALAGCLDRAPADESPPSPSPTPDTPTATPERAVVGSGLSDVSSSCGSAENSASVSYASHTATVEGTIGGSDTCDTAKLQSVTYDGSTLRIVVVAEQREMTGTPVCGQCLTDIEYTATVELEGPDPDTIVVEHVSMGERTEVARSAP